MQHHTAHGGSLREIKNFYEEMLFLTSHIGLSMPERQVLESYLIGSTDPNLKLVSEHSETSASIKISAEMNRDKQRLGLMNRLTLYF